MATLTPEQRQEIQMARDEPVKLEDPETNTEYVIVKAEIYERLQPLLHGGVEIPDGIRRSKEAYRREVSELMKDKTLHGQWVAYHGEERVGIAKDSRPLIEECKRRNLAPDHYYLGTVSPLIEVPDMIDESFFELTDSPTE